MKHAEIGKWRINKHSRCELRRTNMPHRLSEERIESMVADLHTSKAKSVDQARRAESVEQKTWMLVLIDWKFHTMQVFLFVRITKWIRKNEGFEDLSIVVILNEMKIHLFFFYLQEQSVLYVHNRLETYIITGLN